MRDLRLSAGVAWMVAAAAGFTVMAAAAKLLPGIPVFEKIFVRSVISVALTLWALKSAGVKIRAHRPFLLAARAILGLAGLSCYFAAIARIPLGAAVTVYNLTPLCAGAIGAIFLGERFGWRHTGAVLIGISGIALISGFTPEVSAEGVAFALGTAVFSAGAYTLVRKLHASEHPMIIVLSFPLLSLPLAALVGGRDFVLPTGMQWFWLLVLGLGTQVGQVCLTHALKSLPASRATQIGYVGVVFAMLLGIPLGDGLPGLAGIFGAVLVFASLLAYPSAHGPPAPAAAPRS